MTLVAVTVFVIPALIITACYTIIVFTIWSKSTLLTPATRKARHMKSESCLPYSGLLSCNKFSVAGNIPLPASYHLNHEHLTLYLPQNMNPLTFNWKVPVLSA